MSELHNLVAAELTGPVDPRVSAMAAAIAAEHGAASRAVLFYGSCLRTGAIDEGLLDFYLIVSDYHAAYRKRRLALANRLVPPNVFYFEHDGLRCKYAVLSEADFERECGPGAWTVSTAARFAQPSRLVWSADPQAAERVIDIVATAAPTLLGWTMPLANGSSAEELWRCAFSLTFDAELRAERLSRSAALVEAGPGRYERFAKISPAAATSRSPAEARRWWQKMQRRGKWYSVLRLAKASFTFAGGADYIAWKINRHSNANIALKPWQRRHPLLAAISLMPRLLRSGAVR